MCFGRHLCMPTKRCKWLPITPFRRDNSHKYCSEAATPCPGGVSRALESLPLATSMRLEHRHRRALPNATPCLLLRWPCCCMRGTAARCVQAAAERRWRGGPHGGIPLTPQCGRAPPAPPAPTLSTAKPIAASAHDWCPCRPPHSHCSRHRPGSRPHRILPLARLWRTHD